MVFVFYYTKNNKKENNIIEENFTEVTSVQVIEETEGGYKYYKTENKEQIEKIVDALENIKIGEKNDTSARKSVLFLYFSTPIPS